MNRALLFMFLAAAVAPLSAQYPGETKLDRDLREDRERRDKDADERKQRARIRAAEDRAAQAEATAQEALSTAQQPPRVVYVQPVVPPAPKPPATSSVMTPEQLALARDRISAPEPDFSITRLPDGNFRVTFRGRAPVILSAEATANVMKKMTEAVIDRPEPARAP